MERSPAVDGIRKALVARYPIIGLVSWEEERVETTLREVARSAFSSPAGFFVWEQTTGLIGPEGVLPDTQDPVKALDAVIEAPDLSMFLFRDLHNHLEVGSLLQRRLRDVRREIAGSSSTSSSSRRGSSSRSSSRATSRSSTSRCRIRTSSPSSWTSTSRA